MLVYTFLHDDKKQQSVEIELLKTDFVEKWKSVLKNSMLNAPPPRWLFVTLSNNERRINNNIKNMLKKLLISFLYINKRKLLDLTCDIKILINLISNPNDLNQDLLNKWHRYFTTLEYNYSKNWVNLLEDQEKNDLFKHIHTINTIVHSCEGQTYWKVPRRILYNYVQYGVQFQNAINPSFNDRFGVHRIWKYCTTLAPNSYDCFTDINNNDYTVWLNEDILGKDQVKAWLDHDDLTKSDITGSLMITPNIIFDPNKLYQKVLLDSEFQKESKLSGKTFDRPPLGNIINLTKIDWNTLMLSKLIKISLEKDEIWSFNESLLF